MPERSMPPRQAMATDRPRPIRSSRSRTAPGTPRGVGRDVRVADGEADQLRAVRRHHRGELGHQAPLELLVLDEQEQRVHAQRPEPREVEIEVAPVRARVAVALLAGQERDAEAAGRAARDRGAGEGHVVDAERARAWRSGRPWWRPAGRPAASRCRAPRIPRRHATGMAAQPQRARRARRRSPPWCPCRCRRRRRGGSPRRSRSAPAKASQADQNESSTKPPPRPVHASSSSSAARCAARAVLARVRGA